MGRIDNGANDLLFAGERQPRNPTKEGQVMQMPSERVILAVIKGVVDIAIALIKK